MSNIILGDNNTTFKVGGNDCSIYLGTTLVYSPTPPTPPVFNGKFKSTYIGGATYTAECDSNTTLYTADTKPSGYQYTAMTDAIIGDCVESLSDEVFMDCTSLSSVTIGSGVEWIGQSAFTNCTSVSSITLPQSVYNIGEYAFYNCTSITSIDLTNVGILNQAAFQRCTSLTSVTFSNNINQIPNMAFGSCSSLTSITIPSSVTSIGIDAFGDCYGLTSCTIGSGVTSIDDAAFYYCTNLSSVTFLGTTPPYMGGSVFEETPIYYGSGYIYVPAQSVSDYQSALSDYASQIRPIQ